VLPGWFSPETEGIQASKHRIEPAGKPSFAARNPGNSHYCSRLWAEVGRVCPQAGGAGTKQKEQAEKTLDRKIGDRKMERKSVQDHNPTFGRDK